MELAESKASTQDARLRNEVSWPKLLKDEIAVSTRSVSESGSEDDSVVSTYWRSVAHRHKTLTSSTVYDHLDLDRLPPNWVVIHVNVTEDRNTMLVTRHQAGNQPIIFCLPLDRQGKREEEEEGSLTFDAAVAELREIIQEANDATRAGKDVVTKEDKQEWWHQRYALDARMGELLSSIEFCWFGAFKVSRMGICFRCFSQGCLLTDSAAFSRPYYKNLR